MKGRTLALLALTLVAGQAAACSYIVQTQLTFAPGSAELDRAQVIKPSEWIDRSYATYPLYTSGAVETGASGPVPRKARALAELRAANTVRALRMMLRTDLHIATASEAYRSPKNRFEENNDFAAIQLYPDLKTSKLPGCNPGLPDGLER